MLACALVLTSPCLSRPCRYYARLTMDFQTNKRVCEEVAIIPTKALKNKIAGYTTHLMKRIQRGPVRGISLKLQEEERERRMDFVPETSAVDTDVIEVDRRRSRCCARWTWARCKASSCRTTLAGRSRPRASATRGSPQKAQRALASPSNVLLVT